MKNWIIPNEWILIYYNRIDITKIIRFLKITCKINKPNSIVDAIEMNTKISFNTIKNFNYEGHYKEN